MKRNVALQVSKYPYIGHPKAHYLSPRTVEIFKYIGVLEQIQISLKKSNNDITNWQYYRYCSTLLTTNDYYGEINHFANKSKHKTKTRYDKRYIQYC